MPPCNKKRNLNDIHIYIRANIPAFSLFPFERKYIREAVITFQRSTSVDAGKTNHRRRIKYTSREIEVLMNRVWLVKSLVAINNSLFVVASKGGSSSPSSDYFCLYCRENISANELENLGVCVKCAAVSQLLYEFRDFLVEVLTVVIVNSNCDILSVIYFIALVCW